MTRKRRLWTATTHNLPSDASTSAIFTRMDGSLHVPIHSAPRVHDAYPWTFPSSIYVAHNRTMWLDSTTKSHASAASCVLRRRPSRAAENIRQIDGPTCRTHFADEVARCPPCFATKNASGVHVLRRDGGEGRVESRTKRVPSDASLGWRSKGEEGSRKGRGYSSTPATIRQTMTFLACRESPI